MIKIVALAAALSLTTTFALAQNGAGSGSAMGNGAATGSMNNGMRGNTSDLTGESGTGATVGMSRSRPSSEDASTSGAPTAAGVNSKGDLTDPGAVKNGANGR